MLGVLTFLFFTMILSLGSPPQLAFAQELRMLALEGVVREAPDPNSTVLATISKGTRLQLKRELRAWYAVELPMKPGASQSTGYVAISDTEWTVKCLPAKLGKLEPGDVFQDCPVAPRMVVVPAGSFIMGSPKSEAGRSVNEGPQRKVSIGGPFAVGMFEVTFDEWIACARTRGCAENIPDDEGFGRGKRPVINVSWIGAQRYVKWLSKLTGRSYRLLSEAEWEYVARAGTKTARFEGVRESELCKYMNGFDKTGLDTLNLSLGEMELPCTDGYANTSPVGSFLPNGFGLYDTLGNVWELTQDCYHPNLSDAPLNGNARDGRCRSRVLRGSSWLHGMERSRLAIRAARYIKSEYSTGGLRVARDLD